MFSFASPDYSLYPFPLWRPITFFPGFFALWLLVGVSKWELIAGGWRVGRVRSGYLFWWLPPCWVPTNWLYPSNKEHSFSKSFYSCICSHTPGSDYYSFICHTVPWAIIALHYCYTQPCLYLVYISFIKPSSNTPEINVFHFLPWSVWYNESQWSLQCLYYKHQFGFSKATSSVTLK